MTAKNMLEIIIAERGYCHNTTFWCVDCPLEGRCDRIYKERSEGRETTKRKLELAKDVLVEVVLEQMLKEKV